VAWFFPTEHLDVPLTSAVTYSSPPSGQRCGTRRAPHHPATSPIPSPRREKRERHPVNTAPALSRFLRFLFIRTQPSPHPGCASTMTPKVLPFRAGIFGLPLPAPGRRGRRLLFPTLPSTLLPPLSTPPSDAELLRPSLPHHEIPVPHALLLTRCVYPTWISRPSHGPDPCPVLLLSTSTSRPTARNSPLERASGQMYALRRLGPARYGPASRPCGLLFPGEGEFLFRPRLHGRLAGISWTPSRCIRQGLSGEELRFAPSSAPAGGLAPMPT